MHARCRFDVAGLMLPDGTNCRTGESALFVRRFYSRLRFMSRRQLLQLHPPASICTHITAADHAGPTDCRYSISSVRQRRVDYSLYVGTP